MDDGLWVPHRSIRQMFDGRTSDVSAAVKSLPGVRFGMSNGDYQLVSLGTVREPRK